MKTVVCLRFLRCSNCWRLGHSSHIVLMLIKMLFQYFQITPISFQDGMNHESHNLLSFDSKMTRCFFKRNLTLSGYFSYIIDTFLKLQCFIVVLNSSTLTHKYTILLSHYLPLHTSRKYPVF